MPRANDLPNLRHLYALTEIARHSSISAAANQIHLSQSALTQGLLGLERLAGVKLFTREARGVVPTPAGSGFLKRAQRAIDYLKLMEREFAGGGQKDRQPIHRMVTTTQLRALVAVARTGGFSQAALGLGLSQPTVHRAARELEGTSKMTLFRRCPTGIEVTWAARKLARYASLALAEVRQGLEEVREVSGSMRGSLAVGSLPLAMTELVPQAVTALLEEFPETDVRIVDGPYEEQLSALLHGELDIIVGALRNPTPSPDMIQQPLFEDLLSIVVRPGHPLLARGELSAPELRALEWIAPRENTPARAAFTSFFLAKGLAPPSHLIECSSLVAIRALLRGSDRAALLPARQVALEVSAGLLAVMASPLSNTSRMIGLTLRKGCNPTRVQARFVALLHSQLPALLRSLSDEGS